MIKSKDNNYIYIIIAAIFVVIAIIIYINLYILPDYKNSNPLESGVGLVEKIQVKELDLDIFGNQQFKKLKYSNSILPDVSEISVGKENPFVIE